MTSVPPLPDQHPAGPDQVMAPPRKPRSVKQFLLASSANLALGAGVIGAIGLVAWIARDQLAMTSVRAFLNSKGIASDVTIENLQFDTAEIHNLRLGSATNPNLVAKRAIIKWRIDSKSKLFIVEHLAAENVTLHFAIDAKGKPDFGALAPLMKPSAGPKRSVISNLTLSNATLLVETPQGQASARLEAWGGETKGWAGRANITPPAAMISKASAKEAPFEPIRVGFSFKQDKASGPSAKPTNLIGFSMRPNGQSLSFGGYEAIGASGNITGQISVSDGGRLRVDTRPITLQLRRVAGPGLAVSGLNVTTNPIFWTQNGAWQTTGWGSLVAAGNFEGLAAPDANLNSGVTRFRIGAARAESGRIQLDYQGQMTGLSGPFDVQQINASGNVTSNLKDITKLNAAELFGQVRISTQAARLPPSFTKSLPNTTPQAVLDALKGRFSGTGSFNYRVVPSNSQISLAGPLTLTGSTGLRASWLPSKDPAPALIIERKPDGSTTLAGLAAGQVALELPALGSMNGGIEGASFGPDGLNLVARNFIVKSKALSRALQTEVTFDRLNFSAPRLGPLNGQGKGVAFVRDGQNGRASLGFDLSATPSVISGSIEGSVEGFGSTIGAGGYGARGGVVNLTGRATRQNQGWQVEAHGQARANSIATANLSASAPTATFAGNGQISDQGNLAPRLTLSGNVKSSLAGGRFGELNVNTAQNETRFSGTISSSQTRLTGNHTTSLNRLSRAGDASNVRIDIAGIRASGPLTLSSSQDGSLWPFTTNLTLDAQSARAGTTSLTQVRLTAPIAVTSKGGDWRTNSNLNLVAQRLTSGDTRLNGLQASGPVSIAHEEAGSIRISAPDCLKYSARSGSFPGEASVGPVSGKICPDDTGRIAVLTKTAPRIFASTQVDPLTIQIGGPNGDQRIEIGDVAGKVTSKAGGGLALDLLATQFGFSLKMPDGSTATIKANEAALNIVPKEDGVGLQGRIGRVSSIGLPVLLSGDATADLTAGAQGLSGMFRFEDIVVKDIEKSPRFGEVTLGGSGTLTGNQVSIIADVREPASTIKMAGITLSHDIATGSGSLDVNASDLLMSPAPLRGRPGLDIVTLIPPLRGVVSDMVGVANGTANMAWSRGAPIISRAKIDTKGLDFATMLGPVTGLTGEVNLDDLLTVRTPGSQTIKVGLFDPGLPIENGTVLFALPGNNTLRLEDASWPFADGKLSVRPATWAFRDGDQSFAIDIDDVDLAKLLRLTEVPNLEIDGKVSGVFPIEVRNGNVEIVGGRLRAREGGGVIRYTGPNASPPPPPPGFFGRIRQRLFGKPAPAGADLAVEALRALEYKILEITVDGRITGELQMGVIIQGANQQVLSGQPFKFNVKMNVPIGQLLDNLNRLNNAGSSPEVLKEIDRVMREDAAPITAPNPPPPPTPLP